MQTGCNSETGPGLPTRCSYESVIPSQYRLATLVFNVVTYSGWHWVHHPVGIIVKAYVHWLSLKVTLFRSSLLCQLLRLSIQISYCGCHRAPPLRLPWKVSYFGCHYRSLYIRQLLWLPLQAATLVVTSGQLLWLCQKFLVVIIRQLL